MDSIRAKSREIIKNLKDKLLHETNEKVIKSFSAFASIVVVLQP